MSGKAGKEREHPEGNTVNIRRLVHDVMMYTLPKCGFPEAKLPAPDGEKNVYIRTNFVEVVGVCTLRVSLTMRDRWMRMFKSRNNSSGFNTENIPHFLETIAVCCPLSYLNTTQSIVNVTFALCNEIIMFFHHVDMDIDVGIVINSTSRYVTSLITMNPFNPSRIEDLFDRFDKLPEYAEWITNFLTNFAIPYGSRENISDLFFEQIKIQWNILKSSFQEKPPVRILRGYLGFLPDHLFDEVIALEESEEEASGNLELESGSKLRGDGESQDSSKLSESGAVGGIELCGRPSPQSVHAAEQVAQDELNRNRKLALQLANVASEPTAQYERNENYLEETVSIELEQLSLAAEGTSQESQTASPQRKRSNKRRSSKKKH